MVILLESRAGFWNASCSLKYLCLPWHPGNAESRKPTEEVGWTEEKLLYPVQIVSGTWSLNQLSHFMELLKKIKLCMVGWKHCCSLALLAFEIHQCSPFFVSPSQKDLLHSSYLSLILLLCWDKSSINHSVQCISQLLVRYNFWVRFSDPTFLTIGERL